MSAGGNDATGQPSDQPDRRVSGSSRKGDRHGLDPDGPGGRLRAPALDHDPVDVDPREPGGRGARRDALAPPERHRLEHHLRAATGRPTRPRTTSPPRRAGASAHLGIARPGIAAGPRC